MKSNFLKMFYRTAPVQLQIQVAGLVVRVEEVAVATTMQDHQ